MPDLDLAAAYRERRAWLLPCICKDASRPVKVCLAPPLRAVDVSRGCLSPRRVPCHPAAVFEARATNRNGRSWLAIVGRGPSGVEIVVEEGPRNEFP